MSKQDGKLTASQSPFVLMPILLLMWGSLAAVSKLLLNHLDSYQVLFYMYGIGAVAFLAIFLIKGRFRRLFAWKLSEIGLLIVCGVLTFGYDYFYLRSLALIPAVEASMLNYLFPLFIVLFAIPMHGEKLNFMKTISIVMGFAGTILLITKGNLAHVAFTNWHGDLFAVLAALCWGLFTNFIKKNRQDMMSSTLFITLVAFVLSAGTLLTSSRWILPGHSDAYGVVWLSLSNIIFGFFLYFRALKYSTASLIASFTFFTPFVTLVFIVWLLGEKLTVMDCLAAFLIIFSVPIQKLGR